MEERNDNPAENQLGAGVSEEDLARAIHASGYPLQTQVAALLTPDFRIQHEWGFRDAHQDTERALDLFASRELFARSDINTFRVRPELELLIECKRSDLPFVFFRSDLAVVPKYPLVAGHGSRGITLTTDDDRSTWSLGPLAAFGLELDPFVIDAPSCSTFSKLVRSGKNLELKGSDPYNSIVLPLMSALHHRASQLNDSHGFYGHLALVIALAVLDAPIVEVVVEEGGSTPRLAPWVRLHRHETGTDDDGDYVGGQLFAIDVVHASYVRPFVFERVLPFADRFAALAQKHHVELATGKGFAPGLGADDFTHLEERIVAVTPHVPIPVDHPRGFVPWVKLVGGQLFEYARQKRALRGRGYRP